MVTGVNVIAIYVTDFEKSFQFYNKVLGLEDAGENGPGHMLKAGELMIYLEASRQTVKSNALSRSDITICFSAESIRYAYETLSKSDVIIAMDYIEYSSEFAMFTLSDPDGNILEFAGTP